MALHLDMSRSALFLKRMPRRINEHVMHTRASKPFALFIPFCMPRTLFTPFGHFFVLFIFAATFTCIYNFVHEFMLIAAM